MPIKDPCKPRACDIQACLKAHNFQEDRCKHTIEALIECCRKWGNKSYVCNGVKVDQNDNKTPAK